MVPAVSDRIPRVPPYSGGRRLGLAFPYQTVTVCGVTFQTLPVRYPLACASSYYPTDAVTTMVWALSLSLATTQEIDLFFLFLQVLRCFSSLRWPESLTRVRPSATRVAPFGCLRIKACLQLPAAFRSLPRPSSPPEAQASSVRSSSLRSSRTLKLSTSISNFFF